MWRGDSDSVGRASGTSIYFLLSEGDVSHWHRVDAAEIWHHYSGAPLDIATWDADAGPPGDVVRRTLGADLARGQRPQLIVEPGHWQSARSLGEWTLVGCTVSPGFEFDHFELAPPGWEPSR
jgi:predicted cupin superfamily sugar epimerase